MTDYFIKTIIGIVATIGSIILILNRFGLIRFGKEKETVEMRFCPAHENLEKQIADGQKGLQGQITEVHNNQIKNIQLHEQHIKALEDGRNEFKILKSELSNLAIGIAVLLDRSGGKPKRWKEDDN